MNQYNVSSHDVRVMCVTRVYYFFDIEVPDDYQGTYREFIECNMVFHDEPEATIIEAEEPIIESFKNI